MIIRIIKTRLFVAEKIQLHQVSVFKSWILPSLPTQYANIFADLKLRDCKHPYDSPAFLWSMFFNNCWELKYFDSKQIHTFVTLIHVSFLWENTQTFFRVTQGWNGLAKCLHYQTQMILMRHAPCQTILHFQYLLKFSYFWHLDKCR